MKKILDCFEYLKRYQIDLFESLCIILECFILKKHSQITPLLQKSKKRQKIYEDYCKLLGQWVKVTPPNPHLNLSKILKVIEETPLEDLGLFFDLITQKKTNNKLFFYTTPLEVSILLNGLLDLKEGESLYNPCFGFGSLFLQIPKGVKIYGEELEERLIKIAKLICHLNQSKDFHLVCNDILKQASFKENKRFMQFDKVICNPPLHSHLGECYIKEDERFFGLVPKNYPEIIFFLHALAHLKEKGVFILRRQIFKNLENKFKEVLRGKLECIIDLPKNIFPYQNYDFCIAIVTRHAEKILYIDASGDYFCQKDGRYNRLKQIEEILSLYRSFVSSEHSKILQSLDELFVRDIFERKEGVKIQEVASIFKGQRVYGGAKDEKIEFFEVGINDFATLGFSSCFGNLRLQGQKERIAKCALKPYDVLISWRGNFPKITILSSSLSQLCVANSGVIVVRAMSPRMALGIYGYFFGSRGYARLCEFCKENLDLKKFKEFVLPKDFENYASWEEEINLLAQELEEVRRKIIKLKEKI